MKINSEAILQKLIDDGYLHRKQGRVYISSGEYWAVEEDVSIIYDPELFLVIHRALFHECVKRGCEIKIKFFDSARPEGTLLVETVDSLIFSGDTSRESFILAYQKVVGI